MICNTIELSFKNDVVESRFNNSAQNCNLVKQSLVDSKINIQVFDFEGNNLTGFGFIAKWTNKDIVIIVNSNEYDSKVTNISYDFEGNIVIKNKSELSKYTGSSFLTEIQAKDYYNVYYIKSELLLNTKIVVTYDIPGEGTKSRAYTIRFDKEEATATLKTNSE